MESALPAQGTCLAGLCPQTFGMFTLSKVTFGLGLRQHRILNTCLNRKADVLATGLKIKDIL